MGDFDCPTCDASFDTQRGRGVHHVHVHGERLPNRTCDYCGESFYSDTHKKYCSKECLLDSDSYSKENHPNWKGGKETAECRICGSSFEYYPSEKKGLFCAACVKNESWREPPGLTGTDHPSWGGGKIEKECDECGSTVRRHPSGFAYDVVLCGRKCHQKWLSDNFSGERHPNWKGGGNEAYGKGWAEARRQVLQRDAYTCVVCGKTKEHLGRNPDVHHIVPVRSFIDAPGADKTDTHVPRNLVTLCVRCHRRADFGHPSKAALERLVEAASGSEP